MFRAAFNLGKNYAEMVSKPSRYEELKENRKKRGQQLMSYLPVLNNISPADRAATSQFWTVQTWFLMRFLRTHSHFLLETFGFTINEDPCSKIELIKLINQLIIILTTHESRKDLIDLMVIESQAMPFSDVSLKEKENSLSSSPSLFILQKDLSDLLNQQIEEGKKVCVLNAANAQRPGASAYERGTVQEALTRMSDCYWMFVIFHDVLKELQKKGMTNIKEEIDVDVLDYQCRYLILLLHFIGKFIENPSYIGTKKFRKDFLRFDNHFYSDMQNTVFELPSDACTMVKCHFGDFRKLKSLADIFDQNGYFKTALLKECEQGTALIGHCAAPDLRSMSSSVDRSCTANSDRQNSRKKDVADKMLKDNINDYLEKAIDAGADTLVLTALGCGAFENDPKNVAVICAEALQNKRERLKNKSIYLVDLNLEICLQFSEIFGRMLTGYNVHPDVVCEKRSTHERDNSYHKKMMSHYRLTNSTAHERAVFEGGNAKTIWFTSTKKNIHPFTEMLQGKLILGRFPNKADAKLIKKKHPHLSLVVSVLQSFELGGQGLISKLPVQTALGWSALGVKHLQLNVKDVKRDDFNIELLIKAVKKIHDEIESGHTVLVHCKAGLSRSATVVLLYLYLYHCNEILGEAVSEDALENIKNIGAWMKERRQQVSLRDFHYDIVFRAAEEIKKQSHDQAINVDMDLDGQLDAYLMSDPFKEDLMQMVWFKEMISAGVTDKSKQGVIQACLNKLYDAYTIEQVVLVLHEQDNIFKLKIHLYNELIDFLSVKFKQSKESIQDAIDPSPENIFARRARQWLALDYHIEGHARLTRNDNIFEVQLLGSDFAPQLKKIILIELAAHIVSTMNLFSLPMTVEINHINDEQGHDENIVLRLCTSSQKAADQLASIVDQNGFAPTQRLNESSLKIGL